MTIQRNLETLVRELPIIGDADRGCLAVLESGPALPFPIARVYYLFGTPPGTRRGRHAHRALHQLAVCVSGSCTMLLDDGHSRHDAVLDRPQVAVELPPMVWHEMHGFSDDCVLMVLASAPYDEADYIRHYDDFLAAVRQG